MLIRMKKTIILYNAVGDGFYRVTIDLDGEYPVTTEKRVDGVFTQGWSGDARSLALMYQALLAGRGRRVLDGDTELVDLGDLVLPRPCHHQLFDAKCAVKR